MDSVHTYDAVKIRVNVHIRFVRSQATASELDAETWAMGIAQGDLSKNTTLLGYIYHISVITYPPNGPCAYRKGNLPARISPGELSEVIVRGEISL